MSGPKVSVYTLTPAQRAAVQAQLMRRQAELERKRREQEQKRLEQEHIKALKSGLSHISDTAKSLVSTVLTYQDIADEAKIHIPESTLKDQIHRVTGEIEGIIAQAERSSKLSDLASMEQALHMTTEQMNEANKKVLKIRQDTESIEEQLQGVLSVKIGNLFQDIQRGNEVNRDNTPALAARAKIEELSAQQWLPPSLRNEIQAMQKRLDTVDPKSIMSVIEIEVQPLIKRCRVFSDLWETYGKEYNDLCRKYEVLVEMNGHGANLQMVPFSEHAIIELKKLIAFEESEAQELAEQTYISDALNAVMVELGYDVWGQREVTKRSGKHFRKSLYHYGTNSAINVTCADDGQITMELGAVDNCDRLPSNDEALELTSQMKSFCDDFAEIERKLESHGVCIKNRISLLPPTASYAQIINISDYDTAQNTKTDERRAMKPHQQRKLCTSE